MAVNLSKLDKYVRQAIETSSATAKHDTGFRVTDSTTGKRYRYVQFNEATGVTVTPLWPMGIAIASDDPNILTADYSASAVMQPCAIGVCTCSTSGEYGWVEERNPAMPTDCMVSVAATIGEALYWAADGYLTWAKLDSTVDTFPAAIPLETNGANASAKIQWV